MERTEAKRTHREPKGRLKDRAYARRKRREPKEKSNLNGKRRGRKREQYQKPVDQENRIGRHSGKRWQKRVGKERNKDHRHCKERIIPVKTKEPEKPRRKLSRIRKRKNSAAE